MRIEHVALYVNDMDAAKRFFTRYFGARSNELYHNATTGFRSYFLSFDDGARLEIMTRPDMDDLEKPLARTGLVHLAFSVESPEAVDRLTA